MSDKKTEYIPTIDLSEIFEVGSVSLALLNLFSILEEHNIPIDALFEFVKQGAIFNDIYFSVLKLLDTHDTVIEDDKFDKICEMLYTNIFYTAPETFINLYNYSLTDSDN